MPTVSEGQSTLPIADGLLAWLRQHSPELDCGALCSAESVRQLADHGWLGLGVPEAVGGRGGGLDVVVEAIARVAAECLTSAFVFWCQRVFVEYLVQTPNEPLRQMLLPEVLEARRFGATGLSNAMKHLAGFEQLRLTARREHGRWVLDGFSPWVSNLAPGQFVVAVAADVPGERPAVFAVPAEAPGVERGDDFALLGLEATQTSSVRFSGVRLDPTWVISDDARSFLPRVRPAFMLFQCGLAWGLARRALEECRGKLDGHRHVLAGEAHEVARRLDALVDEVRHLASLVEFPLPALCRLFEARIALVDLALEAVRLELEACGGKGYFRGSGVERRLREAMFLPILTPSLVQLRTELNKVRGTAS